MKKEARILGIDDGPFDKFRDKTSIVVGTVFRGGASLDAVLSDKITIDGNDSTGTLIRMIKRSKFFSQLRCIMLDGIALGGFNVVDISNLYESTGIPVMTIMRDMPDLPKIFATLKKLQMDEKITKIKEAGNIHKTGDIYIQCNGLSIAQAEEFLQISTTNAMIPEPLRIAHIIASGVVRGESYGNA